MCKVRSYRYACGCFKDRPLSYCRKTIAHPASQSPMCSGCPTVVINVDSRCPAHEYSDFEDTWEQRIAAARARHDFARHSSIPPSYGDEYFGSNLTDDDEADYIGSSPANWGGSPPLMDDTARTAQLEAEQELQNLRTQYHYEQWTKWRPYVSSIPARPNPKHPKYRRRPSAKVNGDPSPLRNAAKPEDWGYSDPSIFEEDEMDAPRLQRIGSDGPSESGMSDTSDGSYGSLCDLAKWSFASSYGNGPTSAMLEEDEDMLPNWG